MYEPNDKYSALLTSGYTAGQNVLYVSAVPDNVPTLIVAAKGTDNETVFAVTGKTSNSLTGVSRLKGANTDLDAQTPLTCLNNTEFIQQLIDAITPEHNEDGTHKAELVTSLKATGETVDTGEADNEIVTPKSLADSSYATVADVIGAIYPVGSIYISTLSTNPGTLLGVGTWEAWGAGRAIVGLDATQTEFNTVEKTGGAKTHTLTVNEIPSHSHAYSDGITGGGGGTTYSDAGGNRTRNTTNTGGGGAHNNLQPYITAYFWKRTA